MLTRWQEELLLKEQSQVTLFSNPFLSSKILQFPSPLHGSLLKSQSFFPSFFPISLNTLTSWEWSLAEAEAASPKETRVMEQMMDTCRSSCGLLAKLQAPPIFFFFFFSRGLLRALLAWTGTHHHLLNLPHRPPPPPTLLPTRIPSNLPLAPATPTPTSSTTHHSLSLQNSASCALMAAT